MDALHPFVVMTSSAQVRGKARQYGRYSNVAVIETDGETMPKMISERAKGLRRIARHFGACSVGSTSRCQYQVALGQATSLAAHLNRLHEAANGGSTITADEIDAATNETFRRDLIEAFGGIDGYMASATVMQSDEAGTLLRRETIGEPVVAVAVRCPSTGSEYMLRVPPTTKTAREGVAWTFGLAADAYQPSAQS
jgi:hypothetical protein